MALQLEVVFKETNQSLPVTFGKGDQSLPASFKDFQQVTISGEAEHYDGDYEVIPKGVPQVLSTWGKLMSADVKVAAIPQNYGLVSYNQSKTITVS
jgi:hypothetical protein